MSYLEELLPEFRKGAKIRRKCWVCGIEGICKDENYSFHAHDVDADDWDIVPNKPIDWDYIIKNKCLCWFGVIGREKQKVGTLRKIAEFRGSYTYYIDEDTGFSACRPVRKDEITFYENKNDD